MLRQQNNQKNVINGSTLPIDCQQMFRACGCPATKISQLVSGVKLAKAVNAVLFDGKNQILSNQIITQNEERKGNNVINFNMILKQLKLNSKVAFPQHLIGLSPFKLMDAQQEMTKLIKWLAQCWDQQNHSLQPKYKQNDALLIQQQQGKQNFERNTPHIEKNQAESYIIRNKKTPNNKTALQQQRPADQEEFQGKEMSPSDYGDHQKQQNLFQNVYFLDQNLSPKEEPHLNDSLQMSEKVSKKGSFKIIRPKTTFENQNAGKNQREQSPQKFNGFQDQNKIKVEGSQKYFSGEKQESRKTIPKMAERPPLYKRLDKSRQQIATQNQNRSRVVNERFKEPAPFETQNGSDQKPIKIASGMQKNNGMTQANHNSRNENLSKQINELERQIRKQSSVGFSLAKNSEQLSQKSGLANSRNREKGQRKLFKIDIKQVDEGQRRNIIEWLININLLNSNATIYYERFHQICKNGVIFPEIINHHIGRSGQLAYFKNPIKSAQLHSNYQKVFTYLKQLPNFESELLFMYDYFVPEAFQNAFWSLLNSCYSCFSKGNRKRSKTFNRDLQIRQKINLQSSFENNRDYKQNSHQSLKKAIEQSNSEQYQRIKYGRTQSLKKAIKKTEPRTETQRVDSLQKQSRSKRKGSLDFIKDLPESNYSLKHEQLVQIEEPVEQKKQAKGYKDLHQLKKSHNTSSFINTPKKKNENSASRSRIVSTSSAKKLNEKVELPSISLQMEMKSLGYLKQKGLINFATLDPLPLFEDPIRNGCLINKIICNELKLNYKYNLKPRNIIDCKDNFMKGFSQLKESFVLIPHSYQVHFQNIIKGEMSLFYGIIWHIISATTNKGDVCLKDLRNQSAILSISKNYNFDHQVNQKMEEEVLFWVRQLQQQSQFIAELNIRNFSNLSNSICCHNLLYKIAMAIMPEKYTLKPTYEHPTNNLQQQSNIKKILSYFAHNKILKSELAWKAKSLVKKEKATTIQIMKNLMNYVKNTKKPVMPVQAQNPVVSFVKFARHFSKEESKINQRNNERLETTMANNSFAAPALKKQPPKSLEKKKQIQPIQVPWMRSLGFTGDLSLNNGVILCRLISKLTMKTLNYNENPSSKAECLTNIRKALKLIDKFKWDQEDIASADEKLTADIFKFLKQKYKHSYALKQIC